MLTTERGSSRNVERARRYLATMRPGVSGERGHDATFRAACKLVGKFGLTEEAAFALLITDFNPRCQPPWSADKLAKKVRDAVREVSGYPSSGVPNNLIASASGVLPDPSPKWPLFDATRRAEIIARGPDVAELCDCSPVAFEPGDGGEAAEVVERIFSTVAVPDPLLCVGRSSADFKTRPLSFWIGGGELSASALIVPSPMCAQTGRTKGGKISEHSLQNTGPRRFLIVEFDSGTADEQAALHWHLSSFAPLVLAVHSGRKSLHAWFYCQGLPESELWRFFYYAVGIGADRALWTPSQFARLPAGQREDGARQHVYYFDPAAIRTTETPHE